MPVCQAPSVGVACGHIHATPLTECLRRAAAVLGSQETVVSHVAQAPLHGAHLGMKYRCSHFTGEKTKI